MGTTDKAKRKKQLNYIHKKRRQAPQLPTNIQKAMTENGLEIPKASTVGQFYGDLGLLSNPNDLFKGHVGFKDKLGQLTAQKPKEVEKTEFQKKVIESIESLPKGEYYKEHLTEYEWKCVHQLITRYDDDYEMMAIDFRLNPMQWNVTQIKHKIAIYNRENKEIAEEHQE